MEEPGCADADGEAEGAEGEEGGEGGREAEEAGPARGAEPGHPSAAAVTFSSPYVVAVDVVDTHGQVLARILRRSLDLELIAFAPHSFLSHLLELHFGASHSERIRRRPSLAPRVGDDACPSSLYVSSSK